jgi:Zn-dependent protease/predicted transcriptional regulator
MNGRRELELVTVGGIRIAVDPSWLIIFALVLWSLSAGYFPLRYPNHSAVAYWATGLMATLLFFASVLVHELSHSLVAKRLGHDVKRITLFIFGGMAHLSGEPRTPGEEARIAAVGPLTSIGLGVLFALAAAAADAAGAAVLVVATFRYLAFINVALAIFNLLPGYPLDGGRLLRAWFWRRSRDLRAATSRAANWGNGIAVGLMILGGLQIFAGALVGGLWLIFVGMFLRGAARAGYFGVALEQTLAHKRVRELMLTDVVSVPAEATVEVAIEDYFLRYGYAAFPVAGAGGICGLLPLSAVQACPREERAVRKVREVMRPMVEGLRVDADTTLADALRIMGDEHTGRLVVMDDGKFEGLITRSAIARYAQVSSALEKPAAS